MNRFATIVLGAVLFGSTVHAAVIDTFDTVQEVTLNSAGSAGSSAAAAEAIGGERDLHLTIPPANRGASLSSNSMGLTLLNLDQSTFTRAQGLVVWDGADGDPGVIDYDGLGGVDLTKDNAEAFQIRAGSDLGVTAKLTVYSGEDAFSTVDIVIPPDSISDPSSLVEITIPFADFTEGLGATGPADFKNVGAVSLMLSTDKSASDAAIDFLKTLPNPNNSGTVPEPSSWAIFAMGLAVLGYRHYRQKGTAAATA